MRQEAAPGVLLGLVCGGAVLALIGLVILSPSEENPASAPTPGEPTNSPTIRQQQVQPPEETTTEPSPTASTRERDHDAPTPVSGIRLTSNTATTFTLVWGAATDNVAVAYYRVMLNGVVVAQVRDTQITLPFPRSGGPARVDIAAIDELGNQSEWRSVVVLPPGGTSRTPTSSTQPHPSGSTTSSHAPTKTATSGAPTTSPPASPSPSPSSPSSSPTAPPTSPSATPPSTPTTESPSTTSPAAPDVPASQGFAPPLSSLDR